VFAVRVRARARSGLPEPQRGRAMREAPASRARGTTRRRLWGHGGGAAGPCTRSGTEAGRQRGSYGRATEGSSASPAAGGRKRDGGSDAHRRG
jgi:hypothetical protein